MKGLKSRALTVLMAVMMLVCNVNTHVFAAENNDGQNDVAVSDSYELAENSDTSSDYFWFGNPNQRMEDDGSFYFSFSFRMSSDIFKPASSSIKVYATATSSNSNKSYNISLYESATDNLVKSVSYKADGVEYNYEFTDLDPDKYYYLYFSKPLFSDSTISGKGRIDYIQ